ncbi:MAG TPA: hypothetical protein VKV36_00050 [Acidimicrobiales bacterium]|nr:hypothetical protein [Acidimicrobiales bacterium]
MTEPVVDDARFAEAQRLVKVAALRGSPLDGDRCRTCLYYLDPSEDLSFCWHEKLQSLVGGDWWCHFWEMREDDP